MEFPDPPVSRRAAAPTILLLGAIVSIQIGSALAKSLFDLTTPGGVVCLRLSFGAAALWLTWRPRWRPLVRQHASLVVAYGLVLAAMNFSFYSAIARIPVGIAVALEFVGPLGLAVGLSRRWLDGVWVSLAAAGIALLTPLGGFALDSTGVGLALLAGGFWATYVVLAARVGRVFPASEGLVWAMSVGALALLPVGVSSSSLLQPRVLLLGAGVALLSSAIPYSLELEVLRSLPVRVFGVMLSLEPVAAALAAWVVLGEKLSLRAVVAIGAISLAAAGAARFQTEAEKTRNSTP